MILNYLSANNTIINQLASKTLQPINNYTPTAPTNWKSPTGAFSMSDNISAKLTCCFKWKIHILGGSLAYVGIHYTL